MKPHISFTSAALLVLSLLPFSAHAVAAADATGTLSLKTADRTVTAGDAGSWMRPGWDWSTAARASAAVNSTAMPDTPVPFQVKSWRDASGIRLKFFIPDQTRDQVWATSSTLRKGDQIIIVIDPNKSRSPQLENGATPQTRDHLYAITLKDNAVLQIKHHLPDPADLANWKNSPEVSTAASTIPAAGSTTSVYVNNQYEVEVVIPFSELTNTPPLSSDIGIAFAVINDLGAPLTASTDQLTGSAFPLAMPITDTDSPIVEPQIVNVRPRAGAWASPRRWGIGYLSSTPSDSMTVNSIVLPHNPDWYAQAIRLSTCNIGDWDSVPAISSSAQNVTGWYKYYQDDPCQMGVWVNAKNTSTSSTPVDGRLLILWADTFVGSAFGWNVVRLTEPMAFPSNLETITREIWENVPANGSYAGGTTHPCLRVYVLPSALSDPVVTDTFIRAITTSAQVSQMEVAYGIAPYPGTSRAAQMNFTNLGPLHSVCPASEQCAFEEFVGLRSTRSSAAGAAAAGSSTDKRVGEILDPSSKDPLVRVDIAGFGIAASAQVRNYVFLESIGGFGWVAPRSRFKDAQRVKFALGNPPVLARDFSGTRAQDIPSPAREIVLSVRTTTSATNPPRVYLPSMRGKAFAPGETVMAQAEIKSEDGPCPSWCGPCKNLNLTRNDGSGWDLPGAMVLAGGIAGVGGFAFRKRRRRRADR